MTEADWLTTDDQETMLTWLQGRANKRKLALYAFACCRRIWDLIPDARYRRAVEMAEAVEAMGGPRSDWENLVDGLRLEALPVLNEDELAQLGISELDHSADALWHMDVHCWEPGGNADWAALLAANVPEAETAWVLARQAAYHAALAAIEAACPFTPGLELDGLQAQIQAIKPVRDAERKAQAGLLRDILGNPYHPVTLHPDWWTATVVSLAQAIYDEREFNRMPILADALEEAGCTNEDIQYHCREAGVHVRGCWLVDLVLERG
jgi:hypothetical protein